MLKTYWTSAKCVCIQGSVPHVILTEYMYGVFDELHIIHTPIIHV